MLLIFAHCNPKTSNTTCKTSWLKATDFVHWMMLSPSSSSGNRSHGLDFLKRDRTRWIFSHLGARMEGFFPFPITIVANPLNPKSCGLAHGNCMHACHLSWLLYTVYIYLYIAQMQGHRKCIRARWAPEKPWETSGGVASKCKSWKGSPETWGTSAIWHKCNI